MSMIFGTHPRAPRQSGLMNDAVASDGKRDETIGWAWMNSSANREPRSQQEALARAAAARATNDDADGA